MDTGVSCRGTESYLAPELYGYSSERCTNKVDIYRCDPRVPGAGSAWRGLCAGPSAAVRRSAWHMAGAHTGTARTCRLLMICRFTSSNFPSD